MRFVAESPMLSECKQADANTTSVTLSWQPAAGAVFYTWSYDGDVSVVTTRETAAVVTGLTIDTTYTFNVTVHGRNATGNSVTCEAHTCMLPFFFIFIQTWKSVLLGRPEPPFRAGLCFTADVSSSSSFFCFATRSPSSLDRSP